MLGGMASLAVVCHPARSSSSTAWAPLATWAGDFLEMELHGLGVGEGQRKCGPDAAGRDKSQPEIGALIALIGRLARPRSSPGPLTHEAVLLADAGFILT